MKNKGSSLIEVLVAATILATTLIAITGVIMYSIDRTAQVRHQEQASDLSENLMELFYKERATLGWYAFYEKMQSSSKFCAENESDPETAKLIACDEPEQIKIDETTFSRIANVSVDSSSQTVTVEVVTSWDAGRVGMREVSLKHQFRRIN